MEKNSVLKILKEDTLVRDFKILQRTEESGKII